MDRERCAIERSGALDHVAFVVYEQEVGHTNMPEVSAEWIDPKVVRLLWIPHRDVPGDPFVEAEPHEETEGPCKALFAMGSFFRHRKPRGGK